MASFQEVVALAASTALIATSMAGMLVSVYAREHYRESRIGPLLGMMSMVGLLFFTLGILAAGGLNFDALPPLTGILYLFAILCCVFGSIGAISIGIEYRPERHTA